MLVNGTKKQAASSPKAVLLTGKTGAQTGSEKTKLLNQPLLSTGTRAVFKQPLQLDMICEEHFKKTSKIFKGKTSKS